MSRIRKYVHHWIDNRHGKAKGRYFFRRRGFKQLPLPGLPGSPEFEQAYAAAMAGGPLPSMVGTKRVRVGSIDALVIAYFNSPTFLALSSSTQSTYRGILEAFTRDHGAKPLALLTRKHLEAMLAPHANARSRESLAPARKDAHALRGPRAASRRRSGARYRVHQTEVGRIPYVDRG